MKKSLRFIRVFLVGLAALATLICLVVVIENWRGQRAWAETLAEFAARGERLDGPTPNATRWPPGEANFANAPLLRAIADPRSFDPGVWQRLTSTRFHAYFGPELGHIADWNRQRSIELISVAASAHLALQKPASETEAAALVLTALAPIEADLDGLGQAAQERPFGQYEVEDPFVPGSGRTPRIETTRILAHALCTRVSANLQLGRTEQAFVDTLALVRLGGMRPAKLSLISIGSAGAIFKFSALQAFWEGWKRDAWTAEQYAKFQREFMTFDLIGDLPEVITTRERQVAGGLYPAAALVPKGWLLQNSIRELRLLELARRGFDAAAHRVFPERLRSLTDTTKRMSEPRGPYNYLLGATAINWETILLWQTETQARIELAGVVCALERYRLTHGSYPQKLTDLQPQELVKLPADIITGEPLHYARIEGPTAQFSLYSVGWDGQDDHGETLGYRGNFRPAETGDWVWPKKTSAN